MDTDVLVIGGGAAGLAAATRLRAYAPALRVTLVNQTPFNVYRPWFMYSLPNLMPPEDLRISLADMADRYGFRAARRVRRRREARARRKAPRRRPAGHRRALPQHALYNDT
jgi:glycine/D-amino acid oxidase-like deaminating enzyme